MWLQQSDRKKRQQLEDDMLITTNAVSSAPRRYWVIGGKYESMTFDRLVSGTESLFGPFGDREDAESFWRDLSEKTRGQATVRFTIASEP
jgi:hypothetical protein